MDNLEIKRNMKLEKKTEEYGKKKFRCHGSIVLEKTGKSLATMLTFLIVSALDLFSDENVVEDSEIISTLLLCVGIVMAVVSIVVFFAVLKWRKTTITIEHDAIVWERNTLNKKTLTIGIQNISSINIERNLFERLIGTAKLKLDTASLSTADATDVEVILKKDVAMYYKTYLEMKMSEYGEHVDVKVTDDTSDEVVKVQEAAIVNTTANIEGNVTEVTYRYSLKDIWLHSLYDISIASVIFGIIVVLGGIFGMIVMFSDGEIRLAELVTALIQIGVFGYTTIFSIVGKFFRYYDFSVTRRGNRIYLKYGMLKIREYVVPIEKINCIHIKQSLVSRMFKRYNVSMECVGVGDNENEIAQLTLSLKIDELKERMALILPEYDMEQMDCIKPVASKAVYHKLMRIVWLTFFVICVNIGIYIGMTSIDDFGIEVTDYSFWIFDVVITAILYIWIILNMFMQMKVEAVGIGDEQLVVVNGTYRRDIIMISYRQIQYMTVRKSPISKLTELCAGEINILSGMLGTSKDIPYMQENDVNILGEKICSV